MIMEANPLSIFGVGKETVRGPDYFHFQILHYDCRIVSWNLESRVLFTQPPQSSSAMFMSVAASSQMSKLWSKETHLY